MRKKQKLELTWVGKDACPKLEPRILLEEPSKSYYAKQRMSDADLFDNRLIFGDNLLALKALEQEFAGRVKCVFIDPPYNTGSAFTHYDDGLEHSIWLGLMRDRLEIIRRLMATDGSLWISIDDNECHYLKVICDEIFGRENFVSNVVWQKKYAPANDAIWLSDSHDHILVYAKNKQIWRPFLLPRSDKADAAYKNPDNDSRGSWKAGDYTCNKNSDERPNLYYPIKNPHSGVDVWPKKTAVWRFSPAAHKKNMVDSLIWWGKDGKNTVPSFKRFLDSVRKDGTVSQTVWLWDEVGHTQEGKKEQIQLHSENPFATPKPEKLLSKIIAISTLKDDLILDSFAGSGTTGAVAHKMGRRWIMVELGEHCHTHIIPRLQKVIDGQDKGGVTEATDWKGGGGLRYFSLAPSLLQKDSWGNWVVNKAYNPEMLAAAICKLEGFTYSPSDTHYWQHGHSTETDFIYVTTQTLIADQLQALSDDVSSEKSLLVCCSAFKGDSNRYPNLTLKKIPKMVLTKCEWGHDDYSLNVENLPMQQQAATEPAPQKRAEPVKAAQAAQGGLFSEED